MASGPITSWQIGKQEKQWQTLFLAAPKSLQMVTAATIKKTLALWKKSYNQPRQHIKKQRHYFDNKGLSSQSYGFSSSHVWMWELDNKEGWAPKNWCFWTVVLEKTLESPLDCKEIQPVHPRGNQSWIFTGRTDDEAETPILWPPDVKNWLIWKDPDAGKDWRQEKGTTEDEIVGWHHRLNGHEFGRTLGVGDATQLSHPLSSPSPAFNLSQHQCVFQRVGSLRRVAKVLELQHQLFQWIFRIDFL